MPRFITIAVRHRVVVAKAYVTVLSQIFSLFLRVKGYYYVGAGIEYVFASKK